MAHATGADGVVGIDIGGSGSRAVWRAIDGSDEVRVEGPPVRVAVGGTSLAVTIREVLSVLIDAVGDDLARSTSAVCVGATGLLGLTPRLDDAFTAAQSLLPQSGVLVASDAVTATVGALGGRPGAVIAAGTGAIALGTDLGRVWQRVDGWGHVFGDRGSGSWIGAAALRAATEQHDGRREDAADLLEECRRVLGPTRGWPAVIYTNDQRAGVLASLVPGVIALAKSGSIVAARICHEAGSHLARTLAAAIIPGVPMTAAWTGTLLSSVGPIATAFQREFRDLVPGAALRPPAGSPLDGALALATQAATDSSPPAVVHTDFAAWRRSASERKTP